MNDGLNRILRQFEVCIGGLDQLFSSPIVPDQQGAQKNLEKGIVKLTSLLIDATEHLAASTAFEREEFKSEIERMVTECKTAATRAIVQTMLTITTTVIKLSAQ